MWQIWMQPVTNAGYITFCSSSSRLLGWQRSLTRNIEIITIIKCWSSSKKDPVQLLYILMRLKDCKKGVERKPALHMTRSSGPPRRPNSSSCRFLRPSEEAFLLLLEGPPRRPIKGYSTKKQQQSGWNLFIKKTLKKNYLKHIFCH